MDHDASLSTTLRHHPQDTVSDSICIGQAHRSNGVRSDVEEPETFLASPDPEGDGDIVVVFVATKVICAQTQSACRFLDLQIWQILLVSNGTTHVHFSMMTLPIAQ
jgi:hypothetical protein